MGAPEETSGLADFVVDGKTYKTWYKVVGNLKSGRAPVVTLHGGPGATGLYMIVHKSLWEAAEIPIVIYDQLGNGQSTHLPDAPKEFWTPELFMDELDNLVKHLGIQDNFVLLGHSWGGMLGAQYAATPGRQHLNGLKKLVLASPLSSIALYQAGINRLLEQFPEGYVETVRKHEADGTTESEEYQKLAGAFYAKHICRLDPWPEDVTTSFSAIFKNPTVYHTMLGPSEFTTVGTLKTWDIRSILHNIRVPTLITSGEYDEVQHETIDPFFKLVDRVKWIVFSNSAHLAAYEEPDKYTNTLLEFLTDAK